jgi:hypothetical protein
MNPKRILPALASALLGVIAAVIILALLWLFALLSGCAFPGVDQHEHDTRSHAVGSSLTSTNR